MSINYSLTVELDLMQVLTAQCMQVKDRSQGDSARPAGLAESSESDVSPDVYLTVISYCVLLLLFFAIARTSLEIADLVDD